MIEKNITFIYGDSAEKSIFTPIAEEAVKRGYNVSWSINKLESCEIGFYCQHVNFPQFSRFSVIMLHDIIQQYSNWPDLWFREPWNKYDIGILPSVQFVNNWKKCSQWYYTNPKMGMFFVGWPKADIINKLKISSSKEDFFKHYGLNTNLKTVLYAPAWENDFKQDDFIKSMIQLDVNILIKQAPWPDTYPEIQNNIREMEALHRGLKNVTILPPETNIFEAICVSDILVSEESSTMSEALMMGIPAVSVSDWLIPDVIPSRLPKCDYDFVTKVNKANLSECIGKMLKNYAFYKNEAEIFAMQNFSNIGKTSSMIMDLVDDAISGDPFRHKQLVPNKKESIKIEKYIVHKLIAFKRELYENYAVRLSSLGNTLLLLRKIKHLIIK